MRFLKALSLTFALAVLAFAMLGAGGKGNAMPPTVSGPVESDAGGDAGKASTLYMHSTKAGPMPLPRRQQPSQADASTQ